MDLPGSHFPIQCSFIYLVHIIIIIILRAVHLWSRSGLCSNYTARCPPVKANTDGDSGDSPHVDDSSSSWLLLESKVIGHLAQVQGQNMKRGHLDIVFLDCFDKVFILCFPKNVFVFWGFFFLERCTVKSVCCYLLQIFVRWIKEEEEEDLY